VKNVPLELDQHGPNKRLGATTPPEPPDGVVMDNATILPKVSRSIVPSDSLPLMAAWIHPYPLPSTPGRAKAINPTTWLPMAGFICGGILIALKPYGRE
jgi:hypothetical protein